MHISADLRRPESPCRTVIATNVQQLIDLPKTLFWIGKATGQMIFFLAIFFSSNRYEPRKVNNKAAGRSLEVDELKIALYISLYNLSRTISPSTTQENAFEFCNFSRTPDASKTQVEPPDCPHLFIPLFIAEGCPRTRRSPTPGSCFLPSTMSAICITLFRKPSGTP